MKKVLFLTLVNLILIIFQDYFFIEFFGAGLIPNFVLSLSFAFLVLDLGEAALTSALLGGLIIDLFGIGIIGQNTLIFVLIILIANLLRTYISKMLILQIILLIIATVIYKGSLSFAVVYSGFLNVLLMFVFITLIKKVTRKFLSTTYRIKA